jgi:hypothetical protein
LISPAAAMMAVRVLGADLEVEGVDVGEALEQDRLAFHHRLRGECAAVAEPENGGAVGDDADHVALGGVVVGAARILGDGENRHGDPRRIGERQVALRGHGLRGHDLELAGAAMRVELQRLLIGEGRAVAADWALLVHRTAFCPSGAFLEVGSRPLWQLGRRLKGGVVHRCVTRAVPRPGERAPPLC